MADPHAPPRINDPQHPVPDDAIVVVTNHPQFDRTVDRILQPLRGTNTRDWFSPHAYLCLPLVIGNQYGFVVRSLAAFDATWNGGGDPGDVEITQPDAATPDTVAEREHQFVYSNFGLGIVTIQNRFHFRTPPGINLMTIGPPNFFIDGVEHLTGVVETDNLERDFLFNLKLTRPGLRVTVPAGTPIGCVLPIPRYFVDRFRLKRAEDVFPEEVIAAERAAGRSLAREREERDAHRPHRAGRRYFSGEHADGSAFVDHQTRLKD